MNSWDGHPVVHCGRTDIDPPRHRPHHWRRQPDGSYGDWDDPGDLPWCPGGPPPPGWEPPVIFDDWLGPLLQALPRRHPPGWAYPASFALGCLTGLALHWWRR